MATEKMAAADAASSSSSSSSAVAATSVRNKIPLLSLVSYFGFAVGQCFSFGLVGTFILFFYTDILKISPVAASVIFLIARVWDAVHDPLFAGIIDSLNLKRGKYRPFLGFMPFVLFVITVLAFMSIEGSMTTKCVYAGVTYILWGTLYAISDLPFWSMTTVMSEAPQERAKAATCAMLGVNAGIGLSMTIFPYLTSFFAEGRADQGYLPAVMVLMGIGVVLMLNGFLHTKETVRPQGDAAKVTLLQTFKVVSRNKPLFIILAIFFMNLFTNIAGNFYIYFFTYNLGNAELMAAIGTITICCSLACLITPVLTARFRKRDIFIVLCVLEILARVGLYFTGYESTTAVLVWLTLIIGIFMMTNPLVSAMIADTVEYSYYHTGKRCAAITFAGQTFTGKFSVAVAGGITGLVLSFSGYVPNATQSAETLSTIFLFVALVPVVGDIVRIILLKMYKFNEAEHAEVVAKINRGEFDITHKI